MFKLILIFAMGGATSQSGVSISQAEYRFSTEDKCLKAAVYHKNPKVISYLIGGDQRPMRVIANCFKE